MKIWNRLTEQEVKALSPEERAKVQTGVPCPWCDELIYPFWTECVYLIEGTTKYHPRKGQTTIENPYNLDGLYAQCPHCEKDFALHPGKCQQL